MKFTTHIIPMPPIAALDATSVAVLATIQGLLV